MCFKTADLPIRFPASARLKQAISNIEEKKSRKFV